MLFGVRGERSFGKSLDLTILYSDLQIFRLNNNIKCIPQKRNNNGKKDHWYCKNIEHLLFCYSWNKFTKLNCRFLQLFTPRITICGLSSLSRKKKQNSFSPKLEIWQRFFGIFFAHLGYSASTFERHLQHLLRIKLRPLPHKSGNLLPRIRVDGALTDSCWRRF